MGEGQPDPSHVTAVIVPLCIEDRAQVKVAIVNLTEGGLSGGYRKYLETLVPLLQIHPEITRLCVLLPAQAGILRNVPPELQFAWPGSDRMSGYSWLRARLHQAAPDVVFIPTGRWLSRLRRPAVVMIRNMEPLLVPFSGNSLAEGMRNLARAWSSKRAARRATRIIAVSEHVRDYLIRDWRINPSKVGLVYHGVELTQSGIRTARPKTLDHLEEHPFIFTAGSIRPARGIEDLIRAMQVVARQSPVLRLVIGGKPDNATRSYLKRMERLARSLGISGRISWAGQLNRQEMSWCFEKCAALVFTSRAEACPNVALEAMGHGCFVVSTNQPPMPEFFSESALYYESSNPDSLAGQIVLALDASHEERRNRREKALKRAADFSWQTTADKTAQQLKLAIALWAT